MANIDLTTEQLKELVDDLVAVRDHLEAQLNETQDQVKPVTLDQQSVGRVSRIDAIQQQQMAKANRQNSISRLSRVKMALKAAEKKEYGFCKECDQSIAYARLKARPDSPLCIQCQAAAE